MLRRIEFKLEDITPEDARKIQYALSTDPVVYRAFIDAYHKRGFIVVDKKKSKEELASKIGHGFKIKKEKKIQREQLINESLNR